MQKLPLILAILALIPSALLLPAQSRAEVEHKSRQGNYNLRFMTATFGWEDNANPRLELNLKLADKSNLGAIWGKQKLKIFNDYNTTYYGGFFQLVLKVFNLRAGLVHAERRIHRNVIIGNEPVDEVLKGLGVLVGTQIRYSLGASPIVFGHGVDFIAVDADGGSDSGKDFLMADISLLEIGIQF